MASSMPFSSPQPERIQEVGNRATYVDTRSQIALMEEEAGQAADDLSSDSEENQDGETNIAEAMLAARIAEANLEATALLGARGWVETLEESCPSSSTPQPSGAATAQNVTETGGHVFGSNETVYNPYNPLTSKEYIEQEVAAGRRKRKNMGKLTDESSKTLSPKKTRSGTIEGTSEMTEPARVCEQIRTTPSRPHRGRHTALTHYRSHSAAITTNAGAILGQFSQVRRGLNSQQPPHFQGSRDGQYPFSNTFDLSSQVQANLGTMMAIQSVPLQENTASTPDVSRSSPPKTSAPHVRANETPSPNLPTRKPRRSVGVLDTCPRRRAAVTVTTQNSEQASAASSASVHDRTSLSFTNQSQILARKRRRADRSPQEVPLPPLSSGIGQSPSGRLIARVPNLAAPASSTASRRRAGSSAEAPLSTQQPSQILQTDNSPSFVSQLHALPPDIKQRIVSYVSDVTPVRRRTRILPAMDFLSPPFGLSEASEPSKSFDPSELVFTSELLPYKFNTTERQTLLNIFRNKAPYVPAVIVMIEGMPPVQYHVTNGSFLYKPRLGREGRGWPENRLPTEVFHNIVGHLAREDIRQMRLVNHEFEAKVSNKLFRRVVVPFRPEIYGMLVKKEKPVEIIDVKGKGKAKGLLITEDTTDKDVHDGMKVFQAWGPHINQFAMAFEIDENQLTNPPHKEEFEYFLTHWGLMKWPHPYYNRFEICAQLEKKADEYRCMSMALSNMKNTRDLGLSIDSGLGWLVGPDISDRALLFKDKAQVFGKQLIPDSKYEENQRTWAKTIGSLNTSNSFEVLPRNTMLAPGRRILTRNIHGYYEVHLFYPFAQGFEAPTGWEKKYLDTMPSIELHFAGWRGYLNTPVGNNQLVFQGVDFSRDIPAEPVNPAILATTLPDIAPYVLRTYNQANSGIGHADKKPYADAPLKPNNLSPAQKELLLETEWAQRAFLSSYCMSLTDNTTTFQHVRTLTIAKLSSRYLGSLQRDDIWRSLPQLNALVFYVSPDFRDIQKTDTGVVDAVDIDPSEAAIAFYTLLLKCIAKNWSIKTMTLGYFGGGEQQVGIYGRNKHILPAPLTDCRPKIGRAANGGAMGVNDIVKQDPEDILALPYVEHLTLTNCWIAPSTLKDFVTKLRAPKMQTFTLDSVSLTAHSGFVADPNDSNPIAQPDFSQFPKGPPRLFDPMVGNLYQQRGNVPHPYFSGQGCWTINGCRIGSWRDVIDTITPGPTIDLLRWAYQHTDSFPEARQVGALRRINFKSCGYVRLNNLHGQNFDQTVLGATVNTQSGPLQQRATALYSMMMHRQNDKLLGQIVPSISEEEQEVFRSAFPMRLGWADREAAAHVLEDGQPLGGTGRFSGHVEKLLFPAHNST